MRARGNEELVGEPKAEKPAFSVFFRRSGDQAAVCRSSLPYMTCTDHISPVVERAHAGVDSEQKSSSCIYKIVVYEFWRPIVMSFDE